MNLSGFRAEDAYRPVFTGALSHAYIISGPSREDVNALADTLAAALLCEGAAPEKPCGSCRSCRKTFRGIHPDVTVVDRAGDKLEITVDQVREVRADAVIMPNEAARKVYIIRNADTMNAAAQNALLKSLEEPPAQAAFVLAAENPSLLLPTVRSRCAHITLFSGEKEVSGEASELAGRFFTALESGPLELAGFTFELEKLDRVRFAGFLEAASGQAVVRLRAAVTSGRHDEAARLNGVISALSRARECARANVGAGHISGMLCALLT